MRNKILKTNLNINVCDVVEQCIIDKSGKVCPDTTKATTVKKIIVKLTSPKVTDMIIISLLNNLTQNQNT